MKNKRKKKKKKMKKNEKNEKEKEKRKSKSELARENGKEASPSKRVEIIIITMVTRKRTPKTKTVVEAS